MDNTDKKSALTGDKRHGQRTGIYLARFLRLTLYVALWLAALLAAFMSLTGPVYAEKVLLETSAGYNSNPAEDEASAGSGFTRYSIAAAREFTPANSLELTLSPSMAYQHFWEMENNYQIGIESSIALRADDKRFLPSLFAEAFFYRDALIETDERDALTLGARADWLVSSRYTISCECAASWINYLSDAELFAHGSGNRNNMPMDSGPGEQRHVHPARDDAGMAAGITLDMFISPSLTASAGMAFERVTSSVNMESYLQIAPGATLLWNVARYWQLLLDMKAEQRNYDKVKKQNADIRKINDTQSVEIKLSRFWEKWEVFADLFIARGEYPLHHESYHQHEVQCGLSWSF